MSRWDWDAALEGARADAAKRAARLAQPPAPVELSPECVAAGMRHHRRIGRLGDSKRLQNYYERATRDVGAPEQEPMTNIVPYVERASPVAASSWRGVIPSDMDSALRMAKAIANSGMAPRSYYEGNADPVAACFTAMQLGGEVGLSPMAAVQNIAVINGRPGLFGPAMLAVVEASGKLADIDERIEGEGDARAAVCTVQRHGRKARTFRFSVADAKRAGLWDKRGRNGGAGPWQQYPERMLQARARSFALRDVFPDVLLGLGYSAEELQDIPPEVGPERARDVTPPKAAAPPASDGGGKRDMAPPASGKLPAEVLVPGGDPVYFPWSRAGLTDALAFIENCVAGGGLAGAVMLNLELLDAIADKLPALAERVSAVRAAAAQALAPKSETDPAGPEFGDDPPDDFPGLAPEAGAALDDIAQKMAERRGAAPVDAESPSLPAD